jgi:predicted O-methyltransferase YrrM
VVRGAARSFVRDALVRVTRSTLRNRAVLAVARADPEPFVRGPLWERTVHTKTLENVENWPESVDGFEDLAFLFSSNLLNMGAALLAIDEAAYVYRLVRELGPATLVEIGRFKGGSTLLIAAAMHPDARLRSYDLHVEFETDHRGPEQDRHLGAALDRYGLRDRVELVVADSRTAALPGSCDLVFVDGDHSYGGVRGDYDHWGPALRPGGQLLFHDAVQRPLLNCEPGVAQLVAEIERDDASRFERRDGAGSIAHFIRTAAPG